ncbi:MAG: TRAP transporter small permease [Roseibium sp.]|nr:TRAP transporter small permease [Roseibium sp.]
MQTSASKATGLGRASRSLAKVEDLANLLAAAAIFLLMVLGVVQIVGRTIFNAPVHGYIDLVELSMAGMAFLGAAYCQRLGAHIRMELLIGRFHGRTLWLLEIFGTLVGLGILGVLIWYGGQHFWRSYTLGDTTIDAEFPVWPSKLLVPMAFSLWFLRLLIQLWGSVRLAINPAAQPVGVAMIKDAAEHAPDEMHEAMGDDAPDAGTSDGEGRS